MLIVPITNKLSWKNPPFVTIAIIVISCLVYLLFQVDDAEELTATEEYYQTSGLMEIEIPRYIQYLENRGAPPGQADRHPDIYGLLHQRMESDEVFMRELENNRIITVNEPQYSKWKTLRNSYEKKLSQVTFIHYGLVPANPRAITFFTYMFLHGGVMHLIGNMIFLWLVGCMLEIGCGRIFFAITYILTGLCAAGLFWLFNIHSTAPLVGASGAISGIMGAFTLMYGLRNINIFLSLGFYFNYMKFPAIFLLPIWLGNEFFQLFIGEERQVAYLAHIGGLVSGAFSGYINNRFLKTVNTEIVTEDTPHDVSPLIENALNCIEQLNFEDARKYLKQVLKLDPNNHAAFTHLYRIDRNTPDSPQFHETTKAYLNHLCASKNTQEMLYDVYCEYNRLTHPKISPDLYIRLGTIFATAGYVDDSEKMVNVLLKKKPDLPGIPTLLLKLSRTYKKKEMADNYEKYKKILQSHYPDSMEADIIDRL